MNLLLKTIVCIVLMIALVTGDSLAADCTGYYNIDDYSTESITPVYQIIDGFLYTEGFSMKLTGTANYFNDETVKYNEKTQGKDERFGYVTVLKSPDKQHAIIKVSIGQGGPLDLWLVNYNNRSAKRLEHDLDNHTVVNWFNNSLFEVSFMGSGYKLTYLTSVDDVSCPHTISNLLFFDEQRHIYVSVVSNIKKTLFELGDLMSSKKEVFKLKAYKSESYPAAVFGSKVKFDNDKFMICAEDADGNITHYSFKSKILKRMNAKK